MKKKPSEKRPSMASRYAQAVKDLRQSLNADATICEAADKLRHLIDKIVLHQRILTRGFKYIYTAI